MDRQKTQLILSKNKEVFGRDQSLCLRQVPWWASGHHPWSLGCLERQWCARWAQSHSMLRWEQMLWIQIRKNSSNILVESEAPLDSRPFRDTFTGAPFRFRFSSTKHQNCLGSDFILFLMDSVYLSYSCFFGPENCSDKFSSFRTL